MRLFVILLSVVFDGCVGYKFLVYSPLFGHSHVKLLGTIADVLTAGGHDVTILMPELDEAESNRTGVRLTKRIIRIKGDPRAIKVMKESRAEEYRELWKPSASMSAMLQVAYSRVKMVSYQCEAILNETDLIAQLKAERFDVGISEVYFICGLALFDIIGIKTTLAVTALTQLDPLSYAIGEPTLPTYLPPRHGGGSGFSERLRNLFGVAVFRYVFNDMYESELKHVRQKFTSFRSSYDELIARTSFVFTNSNPYIDFSRAALHKTVKIGGITVSQETGQNLTKDWDVILGVRRHNVLISFGSMARAVDMPEAQKRSLLETFSSMPNVTFIWKFEDDKFYRAASYPNVHMCQWIPQTALLNDARLSLFVTHGGIASTNEVAYSGKPAILVPIFGDQDRNAQMLVRHGGALLLRKTSLSRTEELRAALMEVLHNDRYARNARRLSEQLSQQPISPNELLLRHAEFAARFGRLPNLDPYGRHLSLFQYYLVDIAITAILAANSMYWVLVVLVPIVLVLIAIAIYMFMKHVVQVKTSSQEIDEQFSLEGCSKVRSGRRTETGSESATNRRREFGSLDDSPVDEFRPNRKDTPLSAGRDSPRLFTCKSIDTYYTTEKTPSSMAGSLGDEQSFNKTGQLRTGKEMREVKSTSRGSASIPSSMSTARPKEVAVTPTTLTGADSSVPQTTFDQSFMSSSPRQTNLARSNTNVLMSEDAGRTPPFACSPPNGSFESAYPGKKANR
ncbi:hypothetical protein Q1695_008661 [Nippostrongylus brasiliensis]|nr:hypothetical protein Q1695_008661 [Nippostrongylus brasiliensis]